MESYKYVHTEYEMCLITFNQNYMHSTPATPQPHPCNWFYGNKCSASFTQKNVALGHNPSSVYVPYNNVIAFGEFIFQHEKGKKGWSNTATKIQLQIQNSFGLSRSCSYFLIFDGQIICLSSQDVS